MFMAISFESKQKGGTEDERGFKGCKNGIPPSCFTSGRCGGGFYNVAGEPHGGKFERGGAAESGSGGGPGNFAGSRKFGVGTASYDGLREYLGGWNRGECFAKGAAAASGSGGGPGYFAGVSSDGELTFAGGRTCGGVLNGGVHQKLPEKEDDREVCVGCFAESFVGLERTLIPQDVIKGNTVNGLNVGKGNQVIHVPFSVSQRPKFLLVNEARTIVGPHNFKTTYFSIHEANFLVGLQFYPTPQTHQPNSIV